MFGRLRAYKVSDCLNDEKSAGFGLTKRSVRKKVIDLKMLQKVHICCLFLGLLLLATSLTHVHGAEYDRYTKGGPQSFISSISSTECQLTLPNKTVCSYEYGSGPGTTPTPNEICKIPGYLSPNYGPCNFEVNIRSKEQSGVYTLNYTMRNGTGGEDTFYVYVHSGGVPNGSLVVVEDENMYLRLEDSFESKGGRKCEILYWNGTLDVLLNSSRKSSNHWGREDECGFKVEGVSKNVTGIRRLQMSSSGAAHTYADFTVTFISLDYYTHTGDREEWFVGERKNLYSSITPSKYCELWNPKKEMVQRTSYDYCSYTKAFVTDADDGNWTFIFGINGKLSEETVVREIQVKKRDFETIVNASERFENGQSLLCRIYPGTVTDCRFTRPDGAVLLPREGLGNANYSYFGNGFSKGECGLTIHKIQEVDKGLWNCTVSDGSTQRSGFLNVSTKFPEFEVESHDTRVAVQHESELLLSCSAKRALEYCWFRHPSGLPLRFSTDEVDLDGPYRQYVYNDTLQLGVCAVKIQRANINVDSGEWTCNVGVLGSVTEDNAITITVGVSETNVVSLEKELVVSEGPAVLKCYSVPLGLPLEYCRFIRPDGKGFNVVPSNNNIVLGRYQYEADGLAKGECGLKIVSEINEDEDVGKWTCVARLQGSRQEGYDFITLETDGGLSTGAIVGIVLGCVALLLVIGGVAFIIVRRRSST